MRTTYGTEISRGTVVNRVDDLIGQFYKILPLKENGAATLPMYIESLLREMLGMQGVLQEWQEDGLYLSLVGILQYIKENPECDTKTIRSDVFKALNIIKRLRQKYDAEK